MNPCAVCVAVSGSPAWAGIDLALPFIPRPPYGFPRVGGDRPHLLSVGIPHIRAQACYLLLIGCNCPTSTGLGLSDDRQRDGSKPPVFMSRLPEMSLWEPSAYETRTRAARPSHTTHFFRFDGRLRRIARATFSGVSGIMSGIS